MIEINDIEELNTFIWENKNDILCLYFGATEWCEPCRRLKKKICDKNNLNEMDRLAICYIDVDKTENESICSIYKVNNLPTIIFIDIDKNNNVKILETIIGYDWIGFRMLYDRLLYRKKNENNIN
jgi:thiol-disulfide isomerase/thioredoxin